MVFLLSISLWQNAKGLSLCKLSSTDWLTDSFLLVSSRQNAKCLSFCKLPFTKQQDGSFLLIYHQQNAKCLSCLQIAIYENCKKSPFLQFLCTASSCSIRWFPASKMRNISNSANCSAQNGKIVFFLAVWAKCKMSLIYADCYS